MKLFWRLVAVCAACSVFLNVAATASDHQGQGAAVAELEGALMVKLQQFLRMLGDQGTQQQEGSGLTLFENGEDRLEGTFIRQDGQGLYFLSETDGSSEGQLLITTNHGEVVFHALESSETLVLVTVSNTTLLYVRTEEGDAIYRVPPSHLLLAQNAVEESDDYQVDLLKKNLEQISEEEGVKVLEHLLEMTQEIELIIDMTNALIDQGVNGGESNAARLFYEHALNVESKLRQTSPGAVKSQIQTSSHHHDSSAAVNQQTETCSTFPTTCPAGRCPGSNLCLGMCGRECWCWRFLCGDCCVHRGCTEHDLCCRRSGFRAIQRCWIPIGFSCDRPYRC